MNHWTKHLPEVGTDRYAIDAAELDSRIEAIEAQLASAMAARQALESEAMRWARANWSTDEIAAAIEAVNAI